MYNKQRLHKGTLFTKSFKRLTALVPPLLIYSFVSLSNGEFTEALLIMLGILCIVLLFGTTIDLIKYLRTSYYIENNRFILKTGLMIKKEKDIQISRIQSIDTSESLAHRILKITKVTIQTPGKNILLDAISMDQLNVITSQLYQLNVSIEVMTDDKLMTEESMPQVNLSNKKDEGILLYQLSIIDIVKLTILNISVIRSFILFLFASKFVSNFLIDYVFEQSSQLLNTSISLLTLAILGLIVAIYSIGTIFMIFKHYQFSVFLTDKHLKITRGLLETNSQTVVLENVQSIEEKQNVLMSRFGYTAFTLSIATDENEDENDDKNEEAEDGKVVLLPLVKTNQLTPLMNACFPEYRFESADLITPKRSIRRFIQFRLLFWIIAAVAISMLFWSYAWVIGLIFILLNLLFGYRSQQLNGYKLSEDEITLQVAKRFSVKKTYILRDRILNLKVKQNPFLKKANLARVAFFFAQGQLSQDIELKFIEETDAFELFNWFRPKRGEHNEY
ncbi:PH domain-containing protein [Marinilactibacillus sp. Marseille-P9653]|uniref:PH domain-containing protein n=1 Tax=Marinilactibacillus sp. Marseille-P9653 TaxID=2866583 RepID=UPI001CE3BF52|nr:PH domain-containing protein [Marinilactibacillus sp. Marseille-P9653]